MSAVLKTVPFSSNGNVLIERVSFVPEVTTGKQEIGMFIGVLKTFHMWFPSTVASVLSCLLKEKRKGRGNPLSTCMNPNAVLVLLAAAESSCNQVLPSRDLKAM